MDATPAGNPYRVPSEALERTRVPVGEQVEERSDGAGEKSASLKALLV